MTSSAAPASPIHARWRAAATAASEATFAADRAAITAMCMALYAEDPGLSAMTPAQIHRTLDAFAHQPLRGQAVVLELAPGDLLGYALLVPFYSNEQGGLSCDVDELYVLPTHRSLGLGSSLFPAIESGTFGPFIAISLITTPENLRARRLYERLGFRTIGTTLARPLPSTAP